MVGQSITRAAPKTVVRATQELLRRSGAPRFERQTRPARKEDPVTMKKPAEYPRISAYLLY
jgi:hypothetical protein